MGLRCLNFHEKSRKNINKVLEIQKKAQDNPKVKEYGYDDPATMDFMYFRATGERFDMTKPVTEGHVALFEREWKSFQTDWGNKSNWFSRLYKAPHRIAAANPVMTKVIDKITNAFSYREGHIKTASGYSEKIMKGLQEMIKEKGDKKELDELRRLEKKVVQSTSREEQDKNIYNIHDFIKGLVDRGEPVFLRVTGILDGTVIPKTVIEKEIERNWNHIRSESLPTMFNSFNNIQSMVKNMGDGNIKKGLERVLEKMRVIQEDMLFQQTTDRQVISYDEGGVPFWENPVTKTRREFKGKDTPKEHRKYRPLYVLEIVNTHDKLLNTVTEARDKPESAIEKIVEFEKGLNIESLINRAKARGEESYLASFDPVFYVNKYIQDVAHFNFATRVNASMHEVVKHFGENLRKVENGTLEADNFTETAKYVVDVLIPELQKSVFAIGSQGHLDNFIRTINSLEYVTKIGLNPRSALRNLTQKLFNVHHWGAGIYSLSNKFYNETKNSSHSSMTNGERFVRQVGRFDIKYGREAAARLEGSVDPNLVPKGYVYDQQGGLQIDVEGKQGFLAPMAQKIAEKAGVLHGGIETWNRNGTFKLSFAYNFEMMQRSRDYFENKWMEKYKTENRPTEEKLDDYIEHLSGNAAYHDMQRLHFDYNNWAKSKILRSKGGRFFGQFMHYTFEQFDLQSNYVFEMLKHGSAGKFKGTKIGLFSGKIEDSLLSQEMRRPMRLLAMYGTLGTIESFLHVHLSGIIGNDAYERIERFLEYYWSDPELEPSFGKMSKLMEAQDTIIQEALRLRGSPGRRAVELKKMEALEEKYKKSFGKPEWANNVGPAMGDMLMLADLFDIYNMTPPNIQKRLNLNYEPKDPEWAYNVARIFSTAGARFAYHTFPTFAERGIIPAIRQELSFYSPSQETIGWFGKQTGYDPYKRQEIAENLLYKVGYRGTVLPDVRSPNRLTKKEKEIRKQYNLLKATTR